MPCGALEQIDFKAEDNQSHTGAGRSPQGKEKEERAASGSLEEEEEEVISQWQPFCLSSFSLPCTCTGSTTGRIDGVLKHSPKDSCRGLGRRIHESVEDTKLSTNKQHSLFPRLSFRNSITLPVTYLPIPTAKWQVNTSREKN